MIAQILVKGLLMAAYGVVLLISGGLAGLLVVLGVGWGILASPVETTVFLGIVGLPPLALLMGLVWVPRQPMLAGAIVVGATLLSVGLAAVKGFGLVEDTMIVAAIWLPTGLLGLTTMLLAWGKRSGGSHQFAPTKPLP